jgi:fumarylacetoacetase
MSLNGLMALGRECLSALRRQVSRLLRSDCPDLQDNCELAARLLCPMSGVELLLPAQVGDYTDFYASIFHATNVGSLFRPDNPLLPNYRYVPVAYHGRASSVVVSGFPVRRPCGQVQDEATGLPTRAPSRFLDYELEVGFFVGPGNAQGEPIPVLQAEEHIFGFCLVNDWSARDIQKWEYQPLGPFLAKNFATTISAWIVTAQALAPFRCAALPRAPGDPAPLPYLFSPQDSELGGIDLILEVYLQSERMRTAGIPHVRLSQGNFKDMYWTPVQMLTHHASGGCNLRPGDLIASGTVSGPDKSSRGCLLELTRQGRDPVLLPTGETRRFLEDGDEVVLHGYCEREGFVRVGFGECRGTIRPSLEQATASG